MAKLGRNFKERNWDEADVIEWCQEVETNIIGNVDSMIRYVDWELIVKNGQVQIPCFCYKVESISLGKNKQSVFKPNRRETFLDVSKYIRNGYVYITFVGMPIDEETGYPLIQATHADLCYWYCIKCAYTEPYLNGNIDHSRWDYINNTVALKAVEVSQNLRDWTEADYNIMAKIFGTNIAHAAYYKRMLR